MKKILLLAAVASMALASSAQDYTFTRLWLSTNLPASTNDCRQAIGMGGKFYVNDKANQLVSVYGENGLTNEQLPGGANCGINRDQAGNLVISTAAFPGVWAADSETELIKVVNPSTREEINYVIPADIKPVGRIDFIGSAQGDMLDEGVLYYTCAGGDIYRLAVSGGETDFDNSFAIPMPDGLTADTSTPIDVFTNAEGEDMLAFNYRGGWFQLLRYENEQIEKLASVSVGAGESGLVKANSNGRSFFSFDGKDFVLYSIAPTNANYFDGFALAELGAEAPIFEVPNTATANINAFQGNWLNAEVIDENTVLIYHYAPGKSMAVYKMEKAAAAEVLPTSIELNIAAGQEISLQPGETFQIEVNVLPADATNKAVTFSSSDETVVSVDETGLVTALAPEAVEALKRRAADEGEQVKTVTITVASEADPTVKAEAIFTVDYTPTGVADINSSKAVAGVKYINVAGQSSSVAFDGVNIMVTTYTDGTTSAAKVVK